MKFHKLELNNLNSLYGKHVVDFDAVTGGSGMFLIHGPTGSGKSTLMDALCLALFGLTPRLADHGKQSIDGSDEEASEENAVRIMSLGEWSCSVLLELSVADEQGTRTRYRAGWALRRTNKDPAGKFSKPKRSLSEWVNGEWKLCVESDTQKDWKADFDRMLRGLTFVDFQRTVLLAQFKFREFLEANTEARTAILERMTDSSRFREIGARAAEAKKQAERKVAELEEALEGNRPLSPGERDALGAELQEANATLDTTRRQFGVLETARNFWSSLLEAEGQLDKARKEETSAAARRAQAAATLAGLAEDTRVAPGRAALAAWTEQRRAADELAAKVKASESEAGTAGELTATARAVHESKVQAKTAAAEARTTRLPAVVEAESAWSAAREARRDASQAVTKAQDAATLVDTAAKALGDKDDRLESALAERATARDALARIPAAELLESAEGTVATQAATLETRSAATGNARKAVSDQRVIRDTHAEGRKALEDEEGSTAAAARGARDAAASAALRLEAATRGASAEDFTRRLEAQKAALDRQVGSLGSLKLSLEVQANLDAELHQLKAELDEATRESAEWDSKAAASAKEAGQLAAELLAGEEHLRTLERLLAVITHRDVLRPDEACPVCGGTEHPWRVNPELAPKLDEQQALHAGLAARISATKQAHALAESARNAALQAKQGAEGRASALAPKVAKKEKTRAQAARELESLSRELGLERAEAGAVADAEKAASLEQSRVSTALEQVRTLAKEITRMNDAAGKAAARATEAEHALALHDAQARAHGDALEALRQAAERAAADEAQVRALLLAELGRLDIHGLEPAEGAALVATRAKEVRGLRDVLGKSDGRVREAELEQAGARSALSAARDAAAELAGLAGRAEQAASELEARARLHLGGADPETVRRGLDQAVETASSEETSALRALGEAERRSAELSAALRERQGQWKTQDDQARTAQQALRDALDGLGLSSPDELAPRTLSEEDRHAAAALEESIVKDERNAATLVAAAERRHGELLAACPEGESREHGADDRLAQLKEQVDQARVAVETLAGDVALKAQALENDDKALEQQQGRAQALETAKEDLAQWSLVHKLIGVGDGERFATVVQALNLQRVLLHANEHLRRFMPRYQLEQVNHRTNGPQLDFRVVDEQKQGVSRTIKGLSGGESFIVSLALALGLASMRSSRLRVETLLIDEGFGALDQKTLMTSHQALEALQGAIGVQIGLISHVGYLRDKIGAQIEVRPDGAGRSTLHVGPAAAVSS